MSDHAAHDASLPADEDRADTARADTALSPKSLDILRLAAEADGTPPLSDQALLSLANGRRALIEKDDAIGVIGEGEVDLVVRPGARGRGIGRAVLDSLLSQNGHEHDELRAWAHGTNPAATTLLHEAGFRPVRELLRLSLDPAKLAEAVATARELPAGFEMRSFDPGDPQQGSEWVRVNGAAFASHPEQGRVTLADFTALTSEPWFSAADLRLAYTNDPGQDSVLAGFTWIKTVRAEQEVETELYVIGVDPAFAGIGLGAGLLGETLRRMAAHHPDRITLYVDGDNSSAVALYLRAGFTVEQRSVQFLRSAADRPASEQA